MRRQRYYVIRPRSALQEKLKCSYPGLVELFTDSELWMQHEADRSNLTRAEWQLRVKLLFLISVKAEFGNNLPQVFDELYGPPPYHSEVFDRWWELEPVELMGNVDGIAQTISVDNLKLLAVTGSESVDNWIQQLIDNPQSPSLDEQ